MAHVDPTVAVFQADFPEFEDADTDAIARAIAVAKRMVDTSWLEADYTRAIELYAAHVLVSSQVSTDTGGLGGVISSESLGPINVSYQAPQHLSKSSVAPPPFSTTTYGHEFLLLARLNRGGPRSFG